MATPMPKRWAIVKNLRSTANLQRFLRFQNLVVRHVTECQNGKSWPSKALLGALPVWQPGSPQAVADMAGGSSKRSHLGPTVAALRLAASLVFD